jgi:hypothetical protein
MADSNAISAQGTLVSRNGTDIAELRDITPPALSRNPIETTMHNSEDDSYVVGIRRKGTLDLSLGFLPSGDATHNPVAGLMKAWADGSKDRYEITFPDGGKWIFSGFVTNIAASAPVDDGLTADVSIRPTNGHILLPAA